MSAAPRVLPFALGWFVAGLIMAGSEGRPPIFAEPTEPAPRASPSTAPKSLLSDRTRALVTSASERLLAEAKAFEAPGDSAARPDEPVIVAPGGTVQMAQVVVRSTALRADLIRPPDLPYFRLTPLERDDRRMISGFSQNLLHFLEGRGAVNLNFVQGAGRGADHSREFNRVEIEFKFRW